MEQPIVPAPKRSFNLNLFLIKLDRLAAWILLLVILTYAVTGFGLTKGLIDQDLARSLHLGWLGVIGLPAFIIHTGWALQLACRRHRIWNRFSRFVLLLFYIGLAIFFLYVQFFYTAGQDNPSYNLRNSSAVARTGINTSTLPIFTASELAAYNGLNGQPAYAAVDGLVYDFSSLFRNGQHAGHSAGQDLSAAFYRQHPSSLLNRYKIVGIYK